VLVIDDGSQDDSPQILEELSKQNDNLYYYRKENQGLCATLNQLLGKAKGEYIRYMGSDDVLPIDAVEKQMNFMVAHPEMDLLSGYCKHIDGNGKVIRENIEKPGEFVTYSFERILRCCPLTAPSVIFKKKVYEQVGAFDSSLRLDDWDYWLRVADAGFKIGTLKEITVHYRLHQTNVSNNQALMIEETAKILAKWKSKPTYKSAVIAFCQHEIISQAKNAKSFNFKKIFQSLKKFYPFLSYRSFRLSFWNKLAYKVIKYQWLNFK